ncbi:MAG: pantetheine-phosphate adenylyltransferase [Clostridiales Family XIII bacterium]|jgi:pantetheine-phosphate adenylyltransferase|nr:pantetheine-phosphate adenylyltransferase [Clostridiales Family XIII bacterium]
MKGKILYAGSFDPITNGHLDMIDRSAKLCDRLVVGVTENLSKKARYPVEDRLNMIRMATSHLDNVDTESFTGLLADYAKRLGVEAVVRGLRVTMDFEYELQMAHMNARLYANGIETIFLMTNPAYSFVSSGLVSEVFTLGGDVDGLVPSSVLEYMKNLHREERRKDESIGIAGRA